MRIGLDLRMAMVGSPAYFERFGYPEIPEELTQHKYLNIRMSTSKGIPPGNSRKMERH